MRNEPPSKSANRECYRRFFLTVCIAVFSTLVGLSLGYPTTLTPEKDYGVFRGIARDGWIENGAEIVLPRLASRGNRVDLAVKGWRPGGQPPAELVFSLCGKEVHRATVAEDQSIRVYLTGTCQPRRLEIAVLNPFLGGPTDPRELGVQLESLTLSSKLGVPVVAPEPVFFLTAFSLIALGILALLLPAASQLPVCLFAGAVSAWLIATTHISPISRLFPLWMVWCTALLGVLLAQRAEEGPSKGKRDTPILKSVEFVLFLGVLCVAGYLRFSDLSFGLPMNYHPDEVPKVNAIMRMYASDTLNPQYFLHPTLLLYCTYGMNMLFHLVGGATGEFQNSLVLAGRTVSALAGTLSVGLVYLIGKKLFSSRAGLVAAALLAVFPLHTTCSRYLKEDSLLTFFVLLSFLMIVFAFRGKKPVWLLAAGVFAGCSASVKYSGLLSVGIPVLGALCLEERWIPCKRSTWGFLILGVVAVPLFALLCSPYIVLDNARFVKDFTSEQNHMAHGHYFAITPWAQYWTYHIDRSFYNGVTSPPFFVTFLALGFLAWKRKLSGLMVLALMAAFYFPAEYVKAKPAPQPERYILPCLPFAALAISGFLSAMIKRSSLFWVASLVLLLAPAERAFRLHQDIVPDTRLQLAQWMDEHLPDQARIYVDHKRYSPELSEERFIVTYAPRGAAHRDLDLQLLAEQGHEYLILSSLWYDRYFSQPRTDQAVKQKIAKVFREGEVVRSFEAPSGTYGFHNPKLTLFRLSGQ
ncbi:glycosyltransferase family 39 protein [bacterium]|nr:glycosyltransferase family 39 protein [bacterium]